MRPLSTPAQLLDEYYWATVTREVVAPSRQQVARWLSWYTPPDLDATVAIEQPGRLFVAPPWPEDDTSPPQSEAPTRVAAARGRQAVAPARDSEAPTIIA